MSESTPQNLKNHGRLDPLYHFVLSAILIVNLVISIVHLYNHPGLHAVWLMVLAMGAIMIWIRLRTYPLKVQDRLIRLEERIRLQALAPAAWHAQIYKLTPDQLIGLRFASDDEVVVLAELALEKNLTRKQIKERIQNWRADDFRV